MAGEQGNRTLQRPVAEPLSGFEGVFTAIQSCVRKSCPGEELRRKALADNKL